jgi:hypothetical protein
MIRVPNANMIIKGHIEINEKYFGNSLIYLQIDFEAAYFKLPYLRDIFQTNDVLCQEYAAIELDR